jgi:hypothetical protein
MKMEVDVHYPDDAPTQYSYLFPIGESQDSQDSHAFALRPTQPFGPCAWIRLRRWSVRNTRPPRFYSGMLHP